MVKRVCSTVTLDVLGFGKQKQGVGVLGAV